ncbi:hypothetical protein KSF78_0007106 [Schistosoma japonicum]|nr:hypothetical protein KSF78_0007106 [Schistosoma japonicum]
MLAIILLYTLYFIGNIQYIEGDGVKNIVEGNYVKFALKDYTISTLFNAFCLKQSTKSCINYKMELYATVQINVCFVNRIKQILTMLQVSVDCVKLAQHFLVCNKFELRNIVNGSVALMTVHHVTNVTMPTIVHNGSDSHLPKTTQHTTVTVTNTDKCLLRKPNQTNSNHVIVHYVTNVTKPTIVHNGSNSHLPKTTQHTTVTVTTTDKCLLRKPNQTNSNHVIVHYVTNVTKPTIVHNGSNSHLPKTTQHTTVTVTTTANQKLPKVQNGTVCNGTDKCLLRKPNQTNSNHVIVHYVTNVTKPTIVHNGSIEIRKPKDVQQLGEKSKFTQLN